MNRWQRTCFAVAHHTSRSRTRKGPEALRMGGRQPQLMPVIVHRLSNEDEQHRNGAVGWMLRNKESDNVHDDRETGALIY